MSNDKISEIIDTVSEKVANKVLKDLRGDAAVGPKSECGDGAFECDGSKFECGEYAAFDCGNTFTCNNEFVG